MFFNLDGKVFSEIVIANGGARFFVKASLVFVWDSMVT